MAADVEDITEELLALDPLFEPYRKIIQRRIERRMDTEQRLTQGEISLSEFALGHEYFGLHFRNRHWVFREWAPNAEAVFLIGQMTDWQEKQQFALTRISSDGVWEIEFPEEFLHHGDLYRLRIHWQGGQGDRIPAYTRRVVQDMNTLIFNAQVWHPETAYPWQSDSSFLPSHSSLFIYEAHIGMAQEDQKVATFREFTEYTLPRIVRAGYNTIQLMAIQEHPYYGSFGYQVSSFFAASSRFGTPEELKELIDTAHGYGLRVIMDLVHSHAVSNEVEGLSRFDGTSYQYFHEGARGRHTAWDSRCFDYGKYQVLHFLLSNCRFWLDEYHFDGFRFDGITSMLYLDHGLGKAFTSYEDYFNDNVDEDALIYLGLANQLIHDLRPDAITIAEDISGMPGLAYPVDQGGFGFDYRFAMGVPDYWIKLTKDTADEYWHIGHLWYELTNRRREEKTISYAESHDQALVGDQTLIFRLVGADMYHHMRVEDQNLRTDRGIALHKLIRFITLLTAGNGYLNFMGNEFGHPEWIDFPRQGNNWSYWYARRQWSLADDPKLKYRYLAQFDRDMLKFAKGFDILSYPNIRLLYEHSDDKILAFQRGELIFIFNFHPFNSYEHYRIDAPSGKYWMLFNSDMPEYGGHGRLELCQYHLTLSDEASERTTLSLYLPNRTAIVLMPVQREVQSELM